jgi:hypothetical protein
MSSPFLSIHKTQRGITKAAPVVCADQRSHYKESVTSNDVFMHYRGVSRAAHRSLGIYRPTQNTELLLWGMFFYGAKYTELEQKKRDILQDYKTKVLKLTSV